jgi:21S rRNA (uridine2791-2'-O)-methyltransferase
VKPGGRVLGIDIIPAMPPKGVSTIQGNFLSPGVQAMAKQFLRDDRRRQLAKTATADASSDLSSGEETEDTDTDTESSSELVDRPSYIDLEKLAAREEAVGEADSAEDVKTDLLVNVSPVLTDLSTMPPRFAKHQTYLRWFSAICPHPGPKPTGSPSTA